MGISGFGKVVEGTGWKCDGVLDIYTQGEVVQGGRVL